MISQQIFKNLPIRYLVQKQCKKCFYLINWLVILGFLAACDRDKNKNENEPTLPIVGKWKLTAMTVSPPFEGVTNIFAILEDCVKDDIYEFKANGTFEFSEGATKCNPDDDQIWFRGNYTLNSDSKTLNYEDETYEVLELNNTTLKLSFTEEGEDDGITYTVIQTLTKQ